MNQQKFNDLCRTAAGCRLCPALADRRAVLSRANGTPPAQWMFIAEAPGRLGADRTGMPLHGDASGDAFEAMLAAAGLTRRQCFITNAVLCNPRDDAGRNRKPTAAELHTCSTLLAEQILCVDPMAVFTLGATALSALKRIEPHGLKLSNDCGQVKPWFGRTLVPLYHPSPLGRIHRNMDQQTRDMQRAVANLRIPANRP